MNTEHHCPMCEVALAAMKAVLEGKNDEETLSKFTPDQLKAFKKIKARYLTMKQVQQNDPSAYLDKMLTPFIDVVFNLDYEDENLEDIKFEKLELLKDACFLIAMNYADATRFKDDIYDDDFQELLDHRLKNYPDEMKKIFSTIVYFDPKIQRPHKLCAHNNMLMALGSAIGSFYVDPKLIDEFWNEVKATYE